MVRVIISDVVGSQHASDIAAAISQGYGSDISDQIEVLGNWQALVQRIDSDSNIVALIKSSTGVEYYPQTAENWYPRVQMFMPLGSNNFTQLYNLTSIPVIVTCGAGDTDFENRNNTGYGLGLEFWDNDLVQSADPDASSYANGFILGKLLKIKDTKSCTWWEARYRARMTATRTEFNRLTSPWDLYNGYGIISVQSAIDYESIIASDPYQYWNSVSSIDFGVTQTNTSVTRTFESNNTFTNTDKLTFVKNGNNITVTFNSASEIAFSYTQNNILFTAQVTEQRDFTYSANAHNVNVTFTIHYH